MHHLKKCVEYCRIKHNKVDNAFFKKVKILWKEVLAISSMFCYTMPK